MPSTRVSRLNGPVSASTKVATRKPTVPTATVPPRVVTETSHSAPATRKPTVPTTRSTSDLPKAHTTVPSTRSTSDLSKAHVTTTTTTTVPTKTTTTTSSKPVAKAADVSTKAAIANRKKPTPLSFKPIPGIQGKPATVTKKL